MGKGREGSERRAAPLEGIENGVEKEVVGLHWVDESCWDEPQDSSGEIEWRN